MTWNQPSSECFRQSICNSVHENRRQQSLMESRSPVELLSHHSERNQRVPDFYCDQACQRKCEQHPQTQRHWDLSFDVFSQHLGKLDMRDLVYDEKVYNLSRDYWTILPNPVTLPTFLPILVLVNIPAYPAVCAPKECPIIWMSSSLAPRFLTMWSITIAMFFPTFFVDAAELK